MSSLLSYVATPVAVVLQAIHSALSTFLKPASGPAWALSIVLLTIVVRLILFPLFVKQIHSQRRMQQIAPMVKELQKKHKGDRETLNVEMMKLYKEHNANPVSGCLPMVFQLPVFYALYSVMREFRPHAKPHYGLSRQLLQEGGRAKLFGAPISAAFNSPHAFLSQLGGSLTNVRVVAAVMIVLMGASTFWTQRQLMARAGAVDPQQAQVQKIMLYIFPLSFVVFGLNFPIGVLLYWLTTNIWSMGQQAWVIRRMPPVGAAAASAASAATAGGESRGRFGRLFRTAAAGGAALSAGASAETGLPATQQPTPLTGRPAAGRPQPGARKGQGSRKRKNGRRGGRH